MQIYDMVSRRMFSQISRIPDLIRKFCAKKCGLYAGVYGIQGCKMFAFKFTLWQVDTDVFFLG